MENPRYLQLLETLKVLGYPYLNGDTCEAIQIFIVPGQARLHLQQWLLDIFEPGIMIQPEIELPTHNIYQKLQNIYEHIGIAYETTETIRGNAGHEACLRVLTELAEFALEATGQFDGVERAKGLIGLIAQNTEELFSCEVKIFPPTFPAKHSGSGGELQKELLSHISYWEGQLAHIRAQLEMYSSECGLSVPPTATLISLRREIQQFSETMTEFKIEYEDRFQGKMPVKNPVTGLGAASHKAVSVHIHLASLLEDIESIWSHLESFKNLK